MKIMKYICVCLLIGQICVTPVLSYAEEADQSTENKVTEDSKTSPLPGSEDTNNQPGEHEERTTNSSVKSENSIENATTQSEDNVTDESILQEPNDTKSSELKQQEVRETRGVISSIWGTSPVTFDEETGVLTVEAGTLGTFVQSQYLDNNSKIRKQLVKSIILQEGVKAPENSHYLFAGYGINLSNLVSISGQLDTSDVKNMSGMFTQLSKLESLSELNIDSWDLKNVTDISAMFFMNHKLKSINISGWDTSSITNMERAFEGLSYVETIVLGEKSVFNSTVDLSARYDKFWKRIIPETPESVYLSSDDFMTNYDGSMPGTYILVTNKATLKVKDSTLYVGDKWASKDNFVSATDKEGNVLAVDDLEVEGTVDTSTAGVYEVTYKNGNLSETVKVIVEAKQTGKITLRYVDTYGNPIKDPVDGGELEPQTFIGNIGESADGDLYWVSMRGWQLISELPENIKYEAYPQTYDIVYDNIGVIYISYKDSLGNELKPEERNTDYVSKFDWSLEELPQPVPYEVKPIDIEGYKNTGVEGDPASGRIEVYEPIKRITFIYDKIDNSAINVHDSTIYTGDNWSPMDNFDGAFDKEGNIIDFQNIKVEGFVNSNQAGIYEVKYSYDGATSLAKITVKENKTNLKVKDTTVYVGDKWSPKDNLVSATDKDGNELTVGNLEVEGTVNTSKAGVYEITYKNGSLSETAKIIVKDINEIDQTALEVKDSTLYIGDKWEANDNFISATDKDGNTLKVTDLQIEGVVNTKNVGIYEVTYRNGNLSKIAKITVKEKPSISTSNGDQAGKQSKDNGSKNKQGTNNTNGSLPKAGEQSTFYLSVMGIILLLSGLVMMYRRTKIKN
ncbi:bacterial Ig-like domain-containing protein [Listeria monocytogenes]|nr:DUF5011 domain-containing protein [Listeria monocytogenes]